MWKIEFEDMKDRRNALSDSYLCFERLLGLNLLIRRYAFRFPIVYNPSSLAKKWKMKFNNTISRVDEVDRPVRYRDPVGRGQRIKLA